MPIQLDKILADIANEVALHPNNQDATKKEIDDAWSRVGKNSNLSVHESRSIFKVLQKKYDQEKVKESSAWKLFALMDKIHKKTEPKVELKEEESASPMEEDEEYEMLEVQEEDEGGAGQQQAQSGESGSEGESPNKSNKYSESPEKPEEKPQPKAMGRSQTTPTSAGENKTSNTSTAKLLNSMAGTAMTKSIGATVQQTPSATAAALQKKGITMKKTSVSVLTPNSQNARSVMKNNQGRTPANAGAMHGLEVGKTIQLPDSLKRKLSTDLPSTPQTKRMNQQNTPNSAKSSPTSITQKSSPQRQQHTTTAQLLQLKQDCQEQRQQASASTPPGINLITIPANPSSNLVNGIINTSSAGGGPSSSTAATVGSTTSTNGFSPRIEEIDFRNDIIFESNNTVNGTAITGKVASTSEIINLGNFDNSLPPTFFKNLCNSSRHEALGLYVANVMNRLRARSAAKLEVAILRAILDTQSDELEQ
ncbi:microtubule-associated protein 60 [Haematobia irritans]|uniref:microtubule-associated protein 60 n=1 Tax=Haematobia irritans TaxID=7368 RepID=UPI003F4F489F